MRAVANVLSLPCQCLDAAVKPQPRRISRTTVWIISIVGLVLAAVLWGWWSYSRPAAVSYTHLDVYKRQRHAGALAMSSSEVRGDWSIRRRLAWQLTLAMGLILTLVFLVLDYACLLYTSRCV